MSVIRCILAMTCCLENTLNPKPLQGVPYRLVRNSGTEQVACYTYRGWCDGERASEVQSYYISTLLLCYDVTLLVYYPLRKKNLNFAGHYKSVEQILRRAFLCNVLEMCSF